MSNRLILDRVQDFRRIPNTQEVRLMATHTYVRVSEAGNPPLYAQDGKVFPENSPPFKYVDIPGWFWAHWRRVDPAKRAEIGLLLPEEYEAQQANANANSQASANVEAPQDDDEDVFDVSTLDGMTRKELVAVKKEQGVKGVTKGKTDDELREMLKKALG